MSDTIREETTAASCEDEAWWDFERYNNAHYHPGRGPWVRLLWYLVSLVVFESGWVPLYGPKRWLLRVFGARVGRNLCVKPHVRIKYPWRLEAGDFCSIGQEVWIDNLELVRLGSPHSI
jgi:putative colanic acid biosynthesis acetyltransferase WcaF